jgi:signal transduction histidine kinase
MSPTATLLRNRDDIVQQLHDAQEELESLRRELDHMQRLATLGTLAAGVAHEINNVLTPVLAYAQLASSNIDDRKLQTKAIQKALHGAQTATQITRAMLGFASDPNQAECSSVLAVLDASLECIGRDPSKDRITLVVEVEDAITVQMRPLALQQVLMNLILNAFHVLHDPGGQVKITATSRADGMTSIRVLDTGPGIHPAVAAKLFQPFVTLRRPTKAADGSTEERKGTGLGLAICRRLIEAAGGTISAHSTPGHGATFTLVVPTASKL